MSHSYKKNNYIAKPTKEDKSTIHGRLRSSDRSVMSNVGLDDLSNSDFTLENEVSQKIDKVNLVKSDIEDEHYQNVIFDNVGHIRK